MFPTKKRKPQAGFTLIEAMVVVSISAILLAVGVPNFTAFINDSRVSGNVNEFIGAMTLARTEAVARGRLVTICRSKNALDATPSCESGNEWNSGWLIFVEGSSAAAGAGEYGNTDGPIILRQGPLATNTKAVGNIGAITFNPMGEPVGAQAAAGINFNFSYQDKRPREVCISRTGRVKVIQGATNADQC